MPSVMDEIPESHRDLLTSPLTAALTTVDEKGRPQSTAVGASPTRTGPRQRMEDLGDPGDGYVDS